MYVKHCDIGSVLYHWYYIYYKVFLMYLQYDKYKFIVYYKHGKICWTKLSQFSQF